MQFLDILKARHSEYVLGKNIKISEEELSSYLQEILKYTPSAFNSESQRMLVLIEEKHDGLWDQLIEVMKGIVEGEQFEKTKEKLLGFKKAYGSILFFEDMNVIEKLQDKFPLYKDNFAKWSIEQNGMLQFNTWAGLRDKEIGASLQHYNELIESYVKETYNLPDSWDLKAQMPFGSIEKGSEEKDHMDLKKRFMIKK